MFSANWNHLFNYSNNVNNNHHHYQNQNLEAPFHLMIGNDLFTTTLIRLDANKRLIRIKGRWAINKTMNSKFAVASYY